MDLFKIFDSGHVYGVGRIIVVTTVHQNGIKFIVETLAFSYYDEEVFKGTVIEYDFDASEIINDEFEIRAKNSIYDILNTKYNLTNDISFKNETPTLTEINKSILISLKGQGFHIDTLKDVCSKTTCVSFKEYLNNILSLPPITIKDYPSVFA